MSEKLVRLLRFLSRDFLIMFGSSAGKKHFDSLSPKPSYATALIGYQFSLGRRDLPPISIFEVELLLLRNSTTLRIRSVNQPSFTDIADFADQ